LTDEEIAAVPQFEASPLFNEREKAALAYAEGMTETPVRIPDELFEKLKRHFNDEQIVELTASIAFENYRARFDHALSIGSDQLYR
jgi:alkylhydroperoxidase family enzyme